MLYVFHELPCSSNPRLEQILLFRLPMVEVKLTLHAQNKLVFVLS